LDAKRSLFWLAKVEGALRGKNTPHRIHGPKGWGATSW